MVRRAQRDRPVCRAGRLRPVRVAEERDHPGLVVRDPVVDEVAELGEDDVGVLDEPVDEVARRPAALLLQRLREIPVVERRQRRDSALEQPLDEAAVEVEALAVGGAAPVRLDARPCDREPVALEPERLHQVEVLAPAVVVLAGRVARVAVQDPARRGREAIPDRLAAAVDLRRALDLEGRGRRAPHEAVLSAVRGHPFTAPCMIPPMICLPRKRKMRSSGRIEMNVPVRTSAKSST